MLEIIRVFVAVFLGAASAVIGLQLLRGKCVGFVYKFDESKRHEQQQQEKYADNLAQLAATVTFALFAADISLLFFELGKMLEVSVMATIFSIACDVAMIAFLVLVVRLYMKLGADKDPKAKFKASNTRITLYVLILCALLTGLSILF